MSAARAEALIKGELGIDSLDEVFEWINLDKPLGSASISQVSGSATGCGCCWWWCCCCCCCIATLLTEL